MHLAIGRLPAGKRRLLAARPVRTGAGVRWSRRKDGTILLRYAKNLGPVERALHRIVGGPLELRVPLDRHGSRIWELIDGRRTVLDLCTAAASEFGEELEPVAPRVILLLERLLLRNLIGLEPPETPEPPAAIRRGDPPGDGQRVRRRTGSAPGNIGRTAGSNLDST